MAYVLGLYLWFALRTTRWTLEGEAHVAPYLAGQPVIAAFWHERLPLMPKLWDMTAARRSGGIVRMYVLVSQSRDGRFIGAVLLGTLQQVATVTISSALNLLIVGVVLVAFVIIAPNGLIGLVRGKGRGMRR